MTDENGRERVHSSMRALCPACHQLVDAARILRGGKVFARKVCPDHGVSEALISGDANWFLDSWAFTKPGDVPLSFSTASRDGCPRDCGLCPEHEQHSCLPIVEITNHCNLDCPICLVHNRNSYHMTREELSSILDGLVAREGQVDTLNFSGGEPTVHPDFLGLVDLAVARPEVLRVSVSTNGVRLAADPALCRALAERGVYVNLQLDALDNGVLNTLRGPGNLLDVKQRALANLEAAGARITVIVTVTRGVNEDRIGDAVRLLLERDSILSLMFQPAAYTGAGGASFPHDPCDVVTVPDVVAAIEAQTGGLLTRSDFHPLACSHPTCFGLTYLLRAGDEWIPFPRFVDLDRYVDLTSNRGTIRPDENLERAILDAIDSLWSGADQAPDNDKVLRALKRAIRTLYPEDRALQLEERLRLGESLVKTVFIHDFMDAHTFDLDRIRRCCTHYALPDGRLMPACSYNMFYRQCDPRLVAPAADQDRD